MTEPSPIRLARVADRLVHMQGEGETSAPFLRCLAGVRVAILFFLAMAAGDCAAQVVPSSANYTITHAVFDGGGGVAASASYAADSSAASLGGYSSAASPVVISRSGFAGQLNDPPRAKAAAYLMTLGSPVSILHEATDVDGDSLSFRIDTPPSLGTLSGTLPNLVYTPGAGFTISDQFTFIASDSIADSETVTISVALNHPPVIGPVSNQQTGEGIPVAVQLHATDPNQPLQTLSFSLDPGAPAGASIDPSSGLFSWIPSEQQGPGDYLVTARVFDNGSPVLNAATSFHVFVSEVNQPPALDPVSDQTTVPGVPVLLRAAASDEDVPAQSLLFSLDPGAPAGASIHPVDGTFSWTPGPDAAGRHFQVTIRVADNGSPSLSLARTFTIRVTAPVPPPSPVNTAPLLSPIADQAALSGQTVRFTAIATDVDLPVQKLQFALGPGAPAGAAIDPVSGLFTWPIAPAQAPGDVFVTIVVADDGSPALSASRTAKITILPANTPNTPPILAFIPGKIVAEGSTLSFPVLAGDSDSPAQTLTYSLDPGAPLGAALDPATLQFSWTPSEAQGPGAYNITVRVSDNGTPPLSATRSFSVSVTEVNSAPEIAPVPDQTVRAGELLSFTVRATDPDLPAQAIAFSLVNPPAGAVIDPATGGFSWRPALNHPPGDVKIEIVAKDAGIPAASASRVATVHLLPPLEPVKPPVTLSGTEVEISFLVKPGACYRVETAEDILKWVVAGTGTADSQGRFRFSDSLAENLRGKFYRLVEAPCGPAKPPEPEWKKSAAAIQGTIQFRLSAPPNSCLVVEVSSDLVLWSELASLKADSTGNALFTTAPDAARGVGMFRVRSVVCPAP